METIIAGGVAGATGVLVTCPLEVLKTRLQSGQSSTLVEQRHLWKALTSIVEKEGVRGLWKGLGPTLVGAIPSRAAYFSAYSAAKRQLAAMNNDKETAPVHFLSAGIAGCITATLTNPLWVIRTRLQLETQRTSSGALRTTADIVRREGMGTLWHGLSASYLGIFETCLQWVIYEKMKQMYHNEFSTEAGPLPLFCFASASKLIASVTWYPHEVARTRLRERHHPYRGLWNCFSRIAREEGVSRLYSGMGVHLLRVVPNSAITFLTFELLISTFHLKKH